jgi:type VI secretion system protein ImpJ
MDSLRPIFWGQGMFLQPQHFQQQDAYHEAHVRQYLRHLYPFCWGLRSLEINETALQNFVCEVERCELVLRDGTNIRFQGAALPSNARMKPRPFEARLDPGGRPLGVYLGVRRLQWEQENVDADDEQDSNGIGQHRRFYVEEAETPDLFATNGQTSALKYLVYDVHLLFETELPQEQDYELIKLGELLRAAEGQGAVFSKRYIPPALSVNASSVLGGMLKEVRELLTAKSRSLAEFKLRRGVHTIEMGSRDTVYLLMMQMVNRYTPLFHHYLEIDETHPCTFYALLRQLIGEFSTFSESVSVFGESTSYREGALPPYRHDRLWECFSVAIRVAKDLLNELTKGPDYIVTLEYDPENQYFTADIDEQFFQGNNRFYLSIKVDMTPSDLLSCLTETGKISSREDMEKILPLATYGVRIDYQEIPPDELPRRAHCMYFSVDHHSDLWERVAIYHNIAVYSELPPQDTEMQLMVISEG